MLYRTPDLTPADEQVVAGIRRMRAELSDQLRTPRRWQGGLRRSTQAKAVQGSNSIEGYVVDEQDAAAAIDGDSPLSADQRTWAEILGYRRTLTYVIQMAQVPGFRVDAQTLRTMHFMLLEHDLGKSPGRWRESDIYVRREETGDAVYEGPDPDLVPGLVDEFVASLDDRSADPLVRAAMAPLNLVMIHPVRDGNGRMARIVQTLVLGQDVGIDPTFASIEEWLGRNTDAYYRILAATGQGAWHPENDAAPWVRFNLRAHHMQAQTFQRRFRETQLMLVAIGGVVGRARLPERVEDVLLDAALGMRIRRPGYLDRTGVDERTGTRDLARLSDAGLLTAHGHTRGRYYLAVPSLADVVDPIRAAREPLTDPYPDLA